MNAGRRLRRLGGGTEAAAYSVLSLSAVVLLWELAVRLFAIPRYLLPPPGSVLETMVEKREILMRDFGVTSVEVGLGFLAAGAVGALLGVAIAFSSWAARLLYPIIIGTNALPKVALAPLFVVWMGFGMETKVSVAFLVAFFPVVINTTVGLQAVPPEMVDLARMMGGGAWRTFWKIRVPYALPSVFGGLKIAVTLAVVGAVVGEFVAANEGLGYTIQVATASLQTTVIFANLVALALLALVSYLVVVFFTWLALPGRGHRW